MRIPRPGSAGTQTSIRSGLLAAAALLLAGCVSTTGAPSPSTTTPYSPPAGLSVITEPDQGLAAIDAFLSSARRTLDINMYELSDPTIESILGSDAARGVDVQVVLDQKRERTANSPAFSYLSARGVHVVWAPRSYDASHEKAVVVDGDRALIMTMNFTSRYYATTRDFVVVDDSASDVAAIESVFGADFRGAPSAPTPPGADLVWSPGAQNPLVSLIDSGRRSVSVENEEMSDRAVVSALKAAARRGVQVQVTMTDTGSYHSEFSALQAAGIALHTYPDRSESLYIHAKVIVVDGARSFIGSQNFSAASLIYNRELGLITSNAEVVRSASRVLDADFAGTTSWAN